MVCWIAALSRVRTQWKPYLRRRLKAQLDQGYLGHFTGVFLANCQDGQIYYGVTRPAVRDLIVINFQRCLNRILFYQRALAGCNMRRSIDGLLQLTSVPFHIGGCHLNRTMEIGSAD
jgi:hypothetical protein